MGTLYDKDILHYVRQYARGYIHGHSVGGTNPGLLEAMAETNVNLLNDVSFNRYVGGDVAVYFKDENSLKKLIEEVDMMSEKGKMKDTMERAKLESELHNIQRLVDRIPPDVLAELKQQQQYGKDR